MKEIFLSYLQFLMWQVSEHGLLFMITLLAVPAVWLIFRLTGLLYEEKALSLSTGIFAACSIISTIMFFTMKDPLMFYKPMLLMFIGILTFLVVAPIYCASPKFVVSQARRTFTLDGITTPVANVTQVSVNRCFTRTKRSCLMEIFISGDNSRGRSLYYETNNVAEFKAAIAFLKKYVKIDYDCSFTQSTLEIPFFSVVFKALAFSLFFFTLLLPANQSLSEKRAKMSLPEYKTVVVPKDLYEIEKMNGSSNDVMTPIFKYKNPQIIVFDAGHSTHFLGNYRKALNSFPNPNFDFNIVYLRKSKMYFKHSFEDKIPVDKDKTNSYTTFITKNCKKLCYLDNEVKMLYSTNIETVDPRVSNVQDAINMLNHVQTKRIEQKRLQEKRKAMKRIRDGEDAEDED